MRNSESRKRSEAAAIVEASVAASPTEATCNLELTAQDTRNLLLLVESKMLIAGPESTDVKLPWLSSMFFRLQLADGVIERETYPQEFV